MCNVKGMTSSDSSEDMDDSDLTDSSSESESDGNSSGLSAEVSANPPVENEQNTEEEEEEEDELLKAIKAELNKPRDHPPDITCEDLIVDISFHPAESVLAAASVVGDVLVYKYNNQENQLLNTWELHTKACRDIEFSSDGNLLFSCGKDRSIMITDTETGKLRKFYEDCHEHSLYRIYEFNENVFCSGDENGTVKVWDMRQNNAVISFKEAEEFISDMTTTDSKKFLVCSSGDGIITSYNMTARKPYVQSEDYDVEFNCIQLCKLDTKLAIGTTSGKLYFFNWGEFGYHSDEYVGIKGSVNKLLEVTDNMALAAYDDGTIRAYNFYPHRHIGIVGHHKSSVEGMDISYDGEFIATCSLDESIKFWNIKYFEDVHMNKGKYQKKKTLSNNLSSSNMRNSADFFSGMA